MKTRLFEFITDPKIEILAYVDCDILFAIEGCPTEFVQAGPSWNDYQIRFTRVVHNIDDSLNGIHCGTMVIHREHSRDLLNIWRMELDRKASEGMLIMMIIAMMSISMMMIMIMMTITSLFIYVGDNDAYYDAYYRIENKLSKIFSNHSNSINNLNNNNNTKSILYYRNHTMFENNKQTILSKDISLVGNVLYSFKSASLSLISSILTYLIFSHF